MNKKNIKYIALDLDGTLLTEELCISKKTKEALMKVQEKGITLIIASGRPLNGILPFAKELNIAQNNGIVIASNGSMLYDCTQEKVVFEDRISIEDGKRVFRHLEKFKVYPFFYNEEFIYVEDVYAPIIDTKSPKGIVNGYQEEARLGNFKLVEVDKLSEDLFFAPLKLMVLGDPDYLDENIGEFSKGLEDAVYFARTSTFGIEIIKTGTSKGTSLEKLNIKPEELIAFGDSMNDLSMIQKAKYGIAMKNAMPVIKENAYEVTGSNNEDGIYETLLKYGFLD